MTTLNLLYKDWCPINQYISVKIPSVREIIKNEDEYYSMATMLTSMPIDMMVQLDDNNIDFTAINEYDLFLLLFKSLQKKDTSMIFGDLKLEDFKSKINKQNGNLILYNDKTGAVIDRAIQSQIANTLRKIHHFEKNIRKPANPEAKEYMLRRAREKMRRRKNRVVESQLEGLIVALVNNKEFKYNFEEVLDLSIYQFNESMRQVIKKVDFDNTMHGIYSGTVNAKDLSQDQLNWLIHK